MEKSTDYLRNSDRSPKRALGEYIVAAQLLERRAAPGKVRIVSALPGARGREDLVQELVRMQHQSSESSVDDWQTLQAELDRVESESKFPIAPASKKGVLEELRTGDSDYIVLIGHSDDGTLFLPTGETITTEELSQIQREEGPLRTVILISCRSGTVNKALESFSEVLLRNKMAINVIAHPNPVDALQVPSLLRDFLLHGKTIKQVFMARGYQPITENMERLPGQLALWG